MIDVATSVRTALVNTRSHLLEDRDWSEFPA